MELLLLLSILFWKPVYFLGYEYFYKKDNLGLAKFLEYFHALWTLIEPFSVFNKKDA